MQLLTEHLKLPLRPGADAAITGTMLAGPPPWQSCPGGDTGYAVDPETGTHVNVGNLYADEYHGVLAQWAGKNFATGFTVAWCPCHAEHPVVQAAREGRFVA